MTEHIVAIFTTETIAAAAQRDLESAGIPASAIRLYTADRMSQVEAGMSPVEAPAVHRTSGGGFWAWLTGEDQGTTGTTRDAYEQDWTRYEQRAEAGNTVLSVTLLDDSQIHRTIEIIDSHHPLDIDEHAHEDGVAGDMTTGTPGMSATTLTASPAISANTPMATPASGVGNVPPASTSVPAGREEVVALAEEQIEIGKRVVDRGAVRVRRYVVETPVEQEVTLRGERVTIERRRPVEGTATAGHAFEERTIEVRETEEVPVVAKTAQVVEEVTIRKEATERTETVRDTVRREEVEVTGQDGKTTPRTP